MVSGAHEAPLGFDEPPVRPGLIALLAAVLGGALIIPATSQFWPEALMPPHTGRSDYLHNLRFLKRLLLTQGAALWLVALVLWRRPSLVATWGGDQVLRTLPWAMLMTLAVVHVLGVFFFLPPQQVLSGDPIYTNDHAAQLYRAFGARQLSLAGGGIGGYDPYVNAGTLWRSLPDSSGFEWFARLFSFLGLATLGKLYVLLVELLVPVAVWGCARLSGCGRRATWCAVVLALTYWHGGRPFIGHYRSDGDHSWLLAVLLGLLVTALGVRYLQSGLQGRLRTLVGVWCGLALIGFVHPLGLLVPAVPLVVLMVWGAGRMRTSERFVLLLLPVSLLLLHSWWMVPLMRQRRDLPLPAGNLRLQGLQDLWGVVQQSSLLPVCAIALLALLGVWVLRRRNDLMSLAWVTCIAWCGALVIWGYAMPGVRRFETARFLIAALLGCSVLAGPGLVALLESLRRRVGPGFVTLLLVLLVGWPTFAALLDTRFFYVHRVHAMLDPRFQTLMERLQEAPAPEARLLFESTRPGWLSREGGDGALEALVPVFTHRQVLGVGHPVMAPRDPDLSFTESQLAGRHLATWTAAEFEAFLRRYDIGTVVAHSAGAQRFLAQFAEILHVPEFVGDVRIHEVIQWRSQVQPPTMVRADFDRIEVHGITGEQVTLPYHWLEGLRSSPEVPMGPAFQPDTPAPFLRIRPQGHKTILLTR